MFMSAEIGWNTWVRWSWTHGDGDPFIAQAVEAVQPLDPDDVRDIHLDAEVEVVAVAQMISNLGIGHRPPASERNFDWLVLRPRGGRRQSEAHC